MLPKHEPNKDNNKYANMDREKSRRLQPNTENYRQKQLKLRARETAFPSEEGTNCLFNSKWSAWKTH